MSSFLKEVLCIAGAQLSYLTRRSALVEMHHLRSGKVHLHISRVCRVHTLLQSHPLGMQFVSDPMGHTGWEGRATAFQLSHCPGSCPAEEESCRAQVVHVPGFSRSVS